MLSGQDQQQGWGSTKAIEYPILDLEGPSPLLLSHFLFAHRRETGLVQRAYEARLPHLIWLALSLQSPYGHWLCSAFSYLFNLS